jgi:hypothetical protein
MVLPVLGLLGLGAAGLFGSAGKAIAGGAGEQMSDLYAQDRAEKLDYFKRKRLMEESNKISRQAKIAEDKEKVKLAEKAAIKEAKMQISNLENAGYTRPIAVGIIAGGKSAVDRAIEFSNSLEVDPETGLKPNVSTYFQLTSNSKPVSDMPFERRTDLTQRSPDDWVSLASKFYNPYSDIPSGIGARRIKGPVPKQEVASDDDLFKKLNTVNAKLALRGTTPIKDFLNNSEIEIVKTLTGGATDFASFDKAYKVLEKRFITDKTGKTPEEIEAALIKTGTDAADKIIKIAKATSSVFSNPSGDGVNYIAQTIERGNTADYIKYYDSVIETLKASNAAYTETEEYKARINLVARSLRSVIERSASIQMADTTTTIPVYSTVEEYDNAARERTIQEGDLVKIVKNGKTHFVIHSRYDLNSKKGVLYRVGATQIGMN